MRGGDSRYNKVIVDGVVVNDPGGTFDFGVVPMEQVDHIEFVRGAESTLYGADAMTSVVQLSSRNGTSRVPELRFGAAGGTFGTADGFLSLAGARGLFDYNLFGDEFHTQGQGINDEYFNALQGGNIGVAITPGQRSVSAPGIPIAAAECSRSGTSMATLWSRRTPTKGHGKITFLPVRN